MMSHRRSRLLALTAWVGRNGTAKPLSAREANALIASGEFDEFVVSSSFPETQLVAKIGLDRLEELASEEPQVLLGIESLSHKGIWCSTIFDELGESQMRAHLNDDCPVLLFGVGERSLLLEPGFGVVGSRNLDEDGMRLASEAGAKCASLSHVLISGGARGADLAAMNGAADNGGRILGFLATGVLHIPRDAQTVNLIHAGQLALVSPFAPTAGFSVGAAMGRNKLIYGSSESVFVVSTEFKKGGTWAGALESIKTKSTQVNVWTGVGAPKANFELAKLGAVPITDLKLCFEVTANTTTLDASIQAEQISLF